MLFNHHCCRRRLTNHGLRFHIGSPLGSHTVRLLAASIILQRGGTRKEFTIDDGLLRLRHQPVIRLEMMKLFVMMVQVMMIRLLSGLERRTQFRLNGWRSYWCSRLLVMMLTEDERTDHAKCRAFDEVGLTDVACEAARVEQVIPTAHDELVGLQLVSALGAMLSTPK